jgi:hypothetical protein
MGKKFFAVLGVLACFAAGVYAHPVFNEAGLRDFLLYNSSGSVQISSSITLSDSLPSLNNKDFTIGVGSSVFMSGLFYEGFAFSASTVSFSGGTVSAFRYFSSSSSGAVLNAGNSNVSVSSIRFYSNTAAAAGGALSAYNSRLKISDSVFDVNRANNGKGGAVYVENGDFLFDKVSFSSNSANAGASVYLLSSSGSFSDSTLSYGTSYNSGGGLYVSASSVSMQNVNFYYNEAFASGGAAFIADSQIRLSYSNVSGNKALKAGGFYIENSTAEFYSPAFSNNISSGAAGAVYLLNSQGGFSYAVFNSNRSLLNGGALYIENSTVTVNSGSFSNNFSGQNGGAVYLKSSSLYLNGDVVFNSNFAGSSANDVYLDDDAKLFLDSQGRKIVFNGGIKSNASASGIEIKKTGDGDLVFGGESSLNASIDVSGGSLIVSQNASFDANKAEIGAYAKLFLSRGSTVNISTLSVTENAVFETEGVSSFNAGVLNMDGVLKIGIDARQGSSDLINAQTLNLNSASSLLSFSGNLSKSSNTYDIVHAGAINGTFKETSGNYGARVIWSINQTASDVKLDLTIKSYGDISDEFKGNQKNVIKAIDAAYDDSFDGYGDLWHNVISPMDSMDIAGLQKTADALSGSIYADLFSIASLNRSKESLLEHISVRADTSNSWAFVKGDALSFKQDENSNENFTDTAVGIVGGFDLYNNYSDRAAGILLEYDYHSASLGSDDAVIHDISGGFYGDIWLRAFELKGFLTAGVLQHSVKRYIAPLSQKTEGDFAAYSAKASFQAALPVSLGKYVSFKPFAGADGVFLITSAFDETGSGAQLHFGSKEFITSAAGGGLELSGEGKTFSWFINCGADFFLSGAENKIEAGFVQAGKDAVFEIEPSKRGDMAIKAAAGFEVRISGENVIFLNAGYTAGDNYEDIRANLGFSYRLEYGFGL